MVALGSRAGVDICDCAPVAARDWHHREIVGHREDLIVFQTGRGFGRSPFLALLLVTATVGGAITAIGVGPSDPPRGRALPAVRLTSHFKPATRVASIGKVLFGCQTPGAYPACYGPDQIRAAYGVQELLGRGVTGKGRTIAIVVAFASPSIRADLQVFDVAWGLTDPNLTIVAPFGATWDPTSDEQIGWAG